VGQLFFVSISILIIAVNAASDQSLQSKLAGKIDYVVAADGSGDYKTVQEAINAVADDNPSR
jgi:type IV secretory pathway TrbF-like protein